MTDDVDPRWLGMLKILRRRDPRSERDIAVAAGLSHTTVSKILNGSHRTPLRQTIEALLAVLPSHPEQHRRLMDYFDLEQAEAINTRTEERQRIHADLDARWAERRNSALDPRSDTVILADAIGDLADAITTLAEAITRHTNN